MPYIITERRMAIDNGERPLNAGELNYAITKLLLRYWVHSPQNYGAINDISGATTESLAEFRRRVTKDYEEGKIRQNGDVY